MITLRYTKRLGEAQLLSAVFADNLRSVQNAAQLIGNNENYGCAAHMPQLVMGDVLEAKYSALTQDVKVHMCTSLHN
jgi:hypothetical protein